MVQSVVLSFPTVMVENGVMTWAILGEPPSSVYGEADNGEANIIQIQAAATGRQFFAYVSLPLQMQRL